MGIYDRDYYRPARPTPVYSSFRPRSVVIALIVVNVAVWLADAFSPATLVDPRTGRALAHWLSDHLAVHVYTLTEPWLWWQYLTYGFTHSPVMFGHIFGNMLVLFFLGRDVEERYGSKEFLRLYLTMIVFAAVVWNVANKLAGDSDLVSAYGASGAIAGVVVLYALNFPHRTLLLFFVIPMPAWLLGALVVLYDIYGAVVGGDQVAYSMHLAGAAFAFIYFQKQWNLTRLTEGRFSWLRSPFRGKPRLKVHKPEEEVESDMTKEVDRLLEKISSEGEASLTAKERRILETASREYQKRGKGDRR